MPSGLKKGVFVPIRGYNYTMLLNALISVLLTASILPAERDSVRTESQVPAWTPVVGLSTNLIYDFTYVPHYGFTSIPSVSLEWYPGGMPHYGLGLDVEWPMWRHPDTHRYMQLNNVTLWGRRYFKPRDNRRRGWYLLASGNMGRFGIGWDGHGWQGEGVGASLGIGYKWAPRKSRVYVDIGLAAGLIYALYDPYVYGYDATQWYYYDYSGNPDDFTERNMRLIWLGPTRVYISIGVDLFNRKRK